MPPPIPPHCVQFAVLLCCFRVNWHLETNSFVPRCIYVDPQAQPNVLKQDDAEGLLGLTLPTTPKPVFVYGNFLDIILAPNAEFLLCHLKCRGTLGTLQPKSRGGKRDTCAHAQQSGWTSSGWEQ